MCTPNLHVYLYNCSECRWCGRNVIKAPGLKRFHYEPHCILVFCKSLEPILGMGVERVILKCVNKVSQGQKDGNYIEILIEGICITCMVYTLCDCVLA